MKFETIEDLYLDLLQNQHSSERQALTVLPKLAEAASNTMLRKTLVKHHEESKEQLERLDHILSGLLKGSGGAVCQTTASLVQQAEDLVGAEADEKVRDMGLICIAQTIEHHEIAMYGCLRAFASLIERGPDVRLLDASLREEKEADRWLSILAIGVINDKAITSRPAAGGEGDARGISYQADSGASVQNGLKNPSDRLHIQQALSR
jgi:ferritin-like metal-binding protein YciE